MNHTPQAAIIGTGQMGRAHLQALKRLSIPVAGVLASSPIKGKKFASEQVLPKVYDNLPDLLADPTVDVVHVCTPNNTHFPMAKAVLESGRHVILEKPFTLNSEEAFELFQIAKKKKLVNVNNHNMRFYPFPLESHARVQAGDLGDVRLVQGGYCQDWLIDPGGWNWRVSAEKGGQGRVIGDIGTHWYDLITWILGQEVVEVVALMDTFIPMRTDPSSHKLTKVETEDAAQILMRLSGGGIATLALSQVSAGRKNHLWFEMNGSRQSLGWDCETLNLLWVGEPENGNQTVLMDHKNSLHRNVANIINFPGGQVEGYYDTFVALYNQVYLAISAGNLPDGSIVPDFKEGYHEMVWVDAVIQSAREKRWVKLEFKE
jgi:predicted dehydrogenase